MTTALLQGQNVNGCRALLLLSVLICSCGSGRAGKDQDRARELDASPTESVDAEGDPSFVTESVEGLDHVFVFSDRAPRLKAGMAVVVRIDPDGPAMATTALGTNVQFVFVGKTCQEATHGDKLPIITPAINSGKFVKFDGIQFQITADADRQGGPPPAPVVACLGYPLSNGRWLFPHGKDEFRPVPEGLAQVGGLGGHSGQIPAADAFAFLVEGDVTPREIRYRIWDY